MRRNIAITTVLLTLCMASAFAATTDIPAGTKITVRLASALSSGTAQAGQTVDATVANDVVVGGNTVAKAGDPAKVKVTAAKSSGRLHVPGSISIRLVSVNGNAVHTGSRTAQGKSHTKSNAVKMGGGAAAGALIGGLAGGGKGALIGTLAGGAAGTGVAAATGKQEATWPAESAITFTVTPTPAAAHR